METKLIKVKSGINFILSRIAAVLLTMMTFLVLYQVFTRYVLNSPSAFTEELVRYFLMWTSFIGAAYAFSTRQHMALLLIYQKVGEKEKRNLMILADLLVLLFALFIMTIGGTKLAISARMEYSALLGIPRGLVYSVAPLSGLFIVFIQCINIWEDLAGKVLQGEETL